jgi:FAD/FMN-containing dehydrogenase
MRISVVPGFLGEMQALFLHEYPDSDVIWFGHIGDGNLHINIVKAAGMDDATFIRQCEQVTHVLADKLAAHGGSISAEHGIGLVKKAELGSVRSAAEIDVMRGIRAVLDPAGIMNPGKLFDDGLRSRPHTAITTPAPP